MTTFTEIAEARRVLGARFDPDADNPICTVIDDGQRTGVLVERLSCGDSGDIVYLDEAWS